MSCHVPTVVFSLELVLMQQECDVFTITSFLVFMHLWLSSARFNVTFSLGWWFVSTAGTASSFVLSSSSPLLLNLQDLDLLFVC